MNQKVLFVLIIIGVTFGYVTYQSVKLENKFTAYSKLQSNSVVRVLPEVTLPVFNSTEKYNFIEEAKKGQVLVVHFWATWCGPCEKEFPELVKLTELISKKKNVKFLFIAVNDKKKDVQKFLKKYKNSKNFIILEDKENIHQKSFGTFRLPETFIFNTDLSLKQKFVGSQDWTQKHFVELLYNM
jgi:thiol-disulfide isomerase/thioredoxin